MDNFAKQEVYAALKIRLKRALAAEFYFEACMIEYAIIEDRTSSILSHAKICKDAYREDKLLSNKLNSIALQIGKKHPLLDRKVSLETISAIRKWKEQRNNLVHRSCNRPYNYDELKEVALTGKKLADEISDQAKKVSNTAKKLEADA